MSMVISDDAKYLLKALLLFLCFVLVAVVILWLVVALIPPSARALYDMCMSPEFVFNVECDSFLSE